MTRHNNPEMTAKEQATRRAEREAAQRKAMDRSSGYWCERDTSGIPFMHYPDSSREYWPPPAKPNYKSAGRTLDDSINYGECPMCGQIKNVDDTVWWREHYGQHADEAMNAAEEYQLDQHDPDWRGKKGGVMSSNKAVSTKVPEPQRSFLTYAVEEQHGLPHQVKWARMLLATGYEWRGVVGRQMEHVFRCAEEDGALDYEDCLSYYERHGRNARWTKAKNWFESNAVTPPKPHDQRPGSPEWRGARLEDQITDDLPEWGTKEARDYFHSQGHVNFTGPSKTSKGLVWIDFEMCDDGNMRQVDKPVARFIAAKTKPYIYGEDLQNALKATEAAGQVLLWIAINAEINMRFGDPMPAPNFITMEVIRTVEEQYPKIRLDEVRKAITG